MVRIIIERTDNRIALRARVNGGEVVGRIEKRYPFTGRWLKPEFEWEGGHDDDMKRATRLQFVLSKVIGATWHEWQNARAIERCNGGKKDWPPATPPGAAEE